MGLRAEWPGNAFGGSGSRSFYFLDPDGNRLEIYTDMMKVPDGEQFPRRVRRGLQEIGLPSRRQVKGWSVFPIPVTRRPCTLGELGEGSGPTGRTTELPVLPMGGHVRCVISGHARMIAASMIHDPARYLWVHMNIIAQENNR